MPHAYEVKPVEMHTLLNNATGCHGRKVPKLALSMDVKTLQSSRPSNNSSWVPSPVHMSQFPSQPEIEDLYLSPHGREGRMSERDLCYSQEVELTDYENGEKRSAFHSVYPACVPVTYHCSNVSPMPVESISKGQLPRRLPSNAHDHTRAGRPHYSRLRPAAFCPSLPQSTAPSFKPVNPSPPPTQSSPSLPLHQPRPFKRIPIISLSRLALACEDFAAPPIASHKSRRRNEIASNNLYLSDFGTSRHLDRHRTRERRTSAESRYDDRLGRVVQCSCGCMESYAIG